MRFNNDHKSSQWKNQNRISQINELTCINIYHYIRIIEKKTGYLNIIKTC